MRPAPRRADEAARARQADALAGLDPSGRAVLLRVTELARRLLGAETAAVSLMLADEQCSLATVGRYPARVPRRDTVCDHTVSADTALLVPDLDADPRFSGDPGLQAAGLRGYAGIPVRGLQDQPVGTLCLLWSAPRTLTPDEQQLLHDLAGWAERELLAAAHAEDADRAREQEQRLRRALDGAPGGVLVVDADLQVQWANRPAVRLFDLFDDGSGGRTGFGPLSALLPTFSRADVGDGTRRTDDSPHATLGRRFVQPGQRREGERFPAELTAGRLDDGSGRLVIFVRDLHDERSERVRLALLRRRTEVVLDAVEQGVMAVDSSGKVAFGNLALSRMVQRRRLDLPGRDWHGLLHGEPCRSAPCALGDPLDLVGRRLGPLQLVRPDGSVLPVEVQARLVHDSAVDDADETGESLGEAGIVVTLTDLTERLRVDRLKDEFLSSVSHELRTPLTSIRGSLGLLASGAVPREGQQAERMLQIALESSDRLSRLVNDILDLGRLQAGQVELHPRRVRLDVLLADAAHAVGGAAAIAGVLLDVDLEGSDLSLMVDADRVVQVLVNLLGNAVKFSAAGTTVHVRARQDAGTVLLDVADAGRGIPQEDLARIFDRFAQVDASDARNSSGTGLGLAIARGLAEQHGGSLSAVSEVGVGSTFTLRLPVADDSPRVLLYAPAEQVPPHLERVLQELGYTLQAGTGPDLVPQVAGLLLAEGAPPEARRLLRAAAATRGLPVLVLTHLAGAAAGALERVDDLPEHLSGTVLLVEDDADLAEVLGAALEQRGLTVRRAVSPAQAREAVLAERPDLIVLDLLLEDGDGFAVVEDLRRLPDAEQCVLVYTALDLDEDQRDRLRTGPTVFLRKGEVRVDDVTASAVALLLASRTRPESP